MCFHKSLIYVSRTQFWNTNLCFGILLNNNSICYFWICWIFFWIEKISIKINGFFDRACKWLNEWVSWIWCMMCGLLNYRAAEKKSEIVTAYRKSQVHFVQFNQQSSSELSNWEINVFHTFCVCGVFNFVSRTVPGGRKYLFLSLSEFCWDSNTHFRAISTKWFPWNWFLSALTKLCVSNILCLVSFVWVQSAKRKHIRFAFPYANIVNEKKCDESDAIDAMVQSAACGPQVWTGTRGGGCSD